ncbi:S-layer homology domain-containing protein [Cohnella herbarum]|uniref:SLH domain-containing protein n=1 Tax=Cohnella herbarum TaxID=2728023 RepID=A0A7Z2VKB8_9BACL|nr:S-layer homology domain-containing protein [Cohnella herbarum]QJD84624.1 hypothetical protein HH215_16510 [Cohnella herbarum]
MNMRALRKMSIFFMSFTLIFTFFPILKMPTSYAASLPTLANPTNNNVGVSAWIFFQGDSVTLTATGVRQTADGITIGDERYIPVGWESTEPDQSGTFVLGAGGYKSTYTPSTGGTFTVTATFQKQIWDGTEWDEVDGGNDTKTRYVMVVSASEALPTHRYAREIDEHNGYVYTAHRGTNEISRTSVEERTVETVVNGVADAAAVALSDNGDLYFTKDSDFNIYKLPASSFASLPVSASVAEVVYTDSSSPYHYNLEVNADGTIYYTSKINGKTNLNKLANGEATTVIEDFNRGISGLAFAPTGDLYILDGWTDVYKATPAQLAGGDQSQLEFIIDVEADTAGLAVLPDGRILYTDYERDQFIWYADSVIPIAQKANPENNQVIVKSSYIPLGSTVALTAAGDRQTADGTTIGDERYVPVEWESTEPDQSGTFVLGAGGYKSTYTPSTGGTFTLTATFHKQVWNGTAWTVAAGGSDTKTGDVTVVSASEALPTHRDAMEIDEHNGYVYTAHRGMGEITRTSVANLTVETVVDGADDVMNVAVSDEGDLYFTRDSDMNIYKLPEISLASLPVNFEEAEVVYTEPTIPDSNQYLKSLEVDTDGVIYYASKVNGITNLNKLVNGQVTTVIEDFDRGIIGLAFAPTGDLYILDGETDVYKATPAQLAGEDQSQLAPVADLDADPAGLAVLPDGRILYTDYMRDQFIWYADYIIPSIKKANPENNQVIVKSSYIPLGSTVALTAAGDRQTADGTTIGDERYIPVEWESTEPDQSGTFVLGAGGYKSTYTPSTGGTFTVTATFQKQVWDGTEWDEVEGGSNTKTRDVRVVSASEALPTNHYAREIDEHNGFVYTAHRWTNEISRTSVSDLTVETVVTGVENAAAVALSANGDLYFTKDSDYRIFKLPAGSFASQSVDASVAEVVYTDPSSPYHYNLEVDADGAIYYTSEINEKTNLNKLANGQVTTLIEDFEHGINGLAFAPTGDLYILNGWSDVYKATPAQLAGEDQSPLASITEIDADTAGLAILPDGSILYTDNDYGRDQFIWYAHYVIPVTQKANRENNQVIVKSSSITLGDTVAMTAAGDRQTAAGTIIGDERYIPVSWTSNESGKSGAFVLDAGGYKSTYTPSTSGNYTITATFQKQTWNGTAWIVAVGATDSKTANLLVSSSGTSTPSPGSDPGPAKPPETPNNSIEVLINGVAEKAGTATKSTRAGQTVTTITLDRQKLADKLIAGGLRTVVTIPVRNGSDIVVGELNGQMVKDMENKQAVLVIQTENANYTLPAQQINIDAISEQLGKSVTLADIKVQVEIATSSSSIVKIVEDAAKKGQFVVVAPPMDFSIRVVYGDKTVEVKKFNAPVERMIAIPDGVDHSKITTAVVVDPDGTVRHVPTKIIMVDGKYYARINSLTNSTYSLVWHPMEFRDMADHWAKAVVNDLGSRMVLSGVGKDTFNPDADITRAEFSSMLVKGLGLAPERGATEFSDVPQSAWYNGSVRTAYSYGLIKGFDDGSFRPSKKITREEAMAMIARAMEITGLQAKVGSNSPEKQLNAITDMESASEWAKASIAECLKAGVVTGKGNGLLEPKATVTRAEVAAMIGQLLQKSELI